MLLLLGLLGPLHPGPCIGCSAGPLWLLLGARIGCLVAFLGRLGPLRGPVCALLSYVFSRIWLVGWVFVMFCCWIVLAHASALVVS